MYQVLKVSAELQLFKYESRVLLITSSINKKLKTLLHLLHEDH